MEFFEHEYEQTKNILEAHRTAFEAQVKTVSSDDETEEDVIVKKPTKHHRAGGVKRERAPARPALTFGASVSDSTKKSRVQEEEKGAGSEASDDAEFTA